MKLKRFEILLPLNYNDGRADAVFRTSPRSGMLTSRSIVTRLRPWGSGLPSERDSPDALSSALRPQKVCASPKPRSHPSRLHMRGNETTTTAGPDGTGEFLQAAQQAGFDVLVMGDLSLNRMTRGKSPAKKATAGSAESRIFRVSAA
jgi:hypothetical protein